MYQIGDQVVYSTHGVCRVVAQEQRVVDRKEVTYLALEPVAKDGSRFMVPTHNAAAMGKIRPMLTPEQWQDLLRTPRIHEGQWIPVDNRRKQVYRELLGNGDRLPILEMICSVYRHKEHQFAVGKKVHQCDDNFLRDAERIIAGELAIVMNMEFPAALAYLREQLQK